MKASKLFIFLTALIAFISCKNETPPPVIPFPNSDFENWTNRTLQNWTTNSCPACYPAYNTYVIQQDSLEVYQGKYSAKFLYNNVYIAKAENKFPLSIHPSSLEGYIKTSIYGADTVSIKIRLYKNTLQVDSGQWLGSVTTNRYVRISVPITHSTTQVDSAKVTINGGHNKTSDPTKTTTLWVDDLSIR